MIAQWLFVSRRPPASERLRYTLQKSFAEIGQILNIPEATAKTYFHRAKPFLRSSLRVYKDQLASAC